MSGTAHLLKAGGPFFVAKYEDGKRNECVQKYGLETGDIGTGTPCAERPKWRVARRAHNPEAAGSSPVPATTESHVLNVAFSFPGGGG